MQLIFATRTLPTFICNSFSAFQLVKNSCKKACKLWVPLFLNKPGNLTALGLAAIIVCWIVLKKASFWVWFKLVVGALLAATGWGVGGTTTGGIV